MEDSIGSHAKKVSRKDLENNLKKYFWKIQFSETLEILKKKVMKNC